MFKQHRLTIHVGRAAPIALAALLAAGCASASKTPSAAPSAASTGSSAGMNGMNGSGSSVNALHGIKPVPTQVLGTTSWQGMKITANAMTAVPFVIYNGTSEQLVKPGPKASFHLMVLLSDAQTGAVIPYATVRATITKGSEVVFDERQWPMISRYTGPHYGNDVSLPGAGTYTMRLLISPPVSARHVEYQHVWLKPHQVTFTFHWKPVS